MAKDIAQWFRENQSGFSGQLSFAEPLAKHTYYRIGGPATVLAAPKSISDLEWLANGLSKTGAPRFVLGAGSNLLVSDQGFDGVVIKASKMDIEISPLGGSRIRTGSGVAISTLLRRASQEGWGGLEFLTGIPGTIGGVVTMNGGTHLGEAKDRLKSVEAFLFSDASGAGGLQNYGSSEFRFDYRKNYFLPKNSVILSAEWEITPDSPEKVKKRIDDVLARRKASQPIDYPSCGSVFKNPKQQLSQDGKPLHAWQVIDALKLRGNQIGQAQFSEKHCNFIINLGGAKATDVKGLIDLAKNRARAELGVELEEEVIYLGSF